MTFLFILQFLCISRKGMLLSNFIALMNTLSSHLSIDVAAEVVAHI